MLPLRLAGELSHEAKFNILREAVGFEAVKWDYYYTNQRGEWLNNSNSLNLPQSAGLSEDVRHRI